MFGGIVKLLGGLAGIANKWLGMKERREHRKAGRNEVELEGFHKAKEARDALDAVERPDRDDTVDSLRDGKF
jgi:hypothetical protein